MAMGHHADLAVREPAPPHRFGTTVRTHACPGKSDGPSTSQANST